MKKVIKITKMPMFCLNPYLCKPVLVYDPECWCEGMRKPHIDSGHLHPEVMTCLYTATCLYTL